MRIRLLARLVHSALTVVILGPALVSARPPNTQRNYGLLGNVLASILDMMKGRFTGSLGDGQTGMKEHSANRRKLGKGKRKGYGPLGKLLVKYLGESFGLGSGGSSRVVSLHDADPHTSFIVMSPQGTAISETTKDAEETQHTSSGIERLRGLRELLRLLWSNFLPDPTFDRAVQQLVQNDADVLDKVPQGEIFITDSQRKQILAWAGACDESICTFQQ